MPQESGCCDALRRIRGREGSVRPLLSEIGARSPLLAGRLSAEYDFIIAECRRGLRDDDDDRYGSSGSGGAPVIDPIVVPPQPVVREDDDFVPA